jgi:hypothetical protein
VDNRSPLEELLTIQDIKVMHIMPKLDARDLCRLASSSKSMHRLFREPVLIARSAHFVIKDPNEFKVTAMLNAYPDLLTTKVKEITNTAGQKIINKTLFQLAYGRGDGEMCLAMKPFFVRAYGSEAAAIQEMEKQRIEMFAGISAEESASREQASKDHLAAILQPVIAAISAEQFNLGKDTNNKLILSPATLSAINTFREEFAKSQPKIIDKGMHFRDNTLLETYDAYVRAAEQWNDHYNKCALFEDGVLSSVLSYVPENDAQKFSQGLYYLQNENEACTRSLGLRDGGKNYYDVIRGDSGDFSLSGSFVDVEYGCEVKTPIARRTTQVWMTLGRGETLQKLCRTKASNLQSLCSLPTSSRRLDGV